MGAFTTRGNDVRAWLLRPCILIKFEACTENLELHKLKKTFINFLSEKI